MLISLCKGLLLLWCGLAVATSVASAQDDPVFVDPDSPSGKEYELPIDSARQQGAPKARAQKPGAGRQAAPLFGAGVEADGAGTTASAGTNDAPGKRDDTSTDAAGEPGLGQAPAGTAAVRKAQAAAPEGAGGLAMIIGAGTGVLLLGGLGGLLLRRRAAR